jgi:hypothetical protein
MHLTALAVPGCPNAPSLEDRLAAVLHPWASSPRSQHLVSVRRARRQSAAAGMMGRDG